MKNALSQDLAAKLDRMRATDRLTLIVVAACDHADAKPRGQVGRNQRLYAQRQAALAVMPQVARVLGKHGGTLMQTEPSALGTIVVEASPAGARAIADLPEIEAVMEDQPIKRAD